MSTIAKAYVQIVPSTKGMGAAIQNSINGSSIGNRAGLAIGKGMMGAIGALGIGTAVYKSIKSAVDKGAELEQSEGGIEALFGKKAAKIVKKNADDAFKTVGMSANQYMENATTYSASLIRGLGGDTKKAAKYVNKALIDMGDNVNRFGTSMESVQNAYKGFSRGNFMMLDNLNLGFSGTKQGMADLINESKVLGKTQVTIGEGGNFEDVATFDVMIDAVHEMQKRLNVTGTTAKEQSKTIQGSMSAVTASFENFMGNLATGKNIKRPLKQLFKTGKTYLANNLFPMVKRVVTTIPEVFGEEIIKNAPKLVIKGMQLIDDLLTGVEENAPKVYQKAQEVVEDIQKSFGKKKDKIMKVGQRLFNHIADGIRDNIPKIVNVATKLVRKLMTFLRENGPDIIKGSAKALLKLAESIVIGVGEAISQGASSDPIATAIVAMLGTMALTGTGFKTLATTIVTKVGTKISAIAAGNQALAAAGSTMGTILGGAVASAAAAYVGLNIGDAIGKKIRTTFGSETQKTEDTRGLVSYLFGDARASATEWKEAFEDAFLDEDSTLYKLFHPSTWFKKNGGGSGKSFGEATETKETTTKATTKATTTQRSTPESLSGPYNPKGVTVETTVNIGDGKVDKVVGKATARNRYRFS